MALRLLFKLQWPQHRMIIVVFQPLKNAAKTALALMKDFSGFFLFAC